MILIEAHQIHLMWELFVRSVEAAVAVAEGRKLLSPLLLR